MIATNASLKRMLAARTLPASVVMFVAELIDAAESGARRSFIESYIPKLNVTTIVIDRDVYLDRWAFYSRFESPSERLHVYTTFRSVGSEWFPVDNVKTVCLADTDKNKHAIFVDDEDQLIRSHIVVEPGSGFVGYFVDPETLLVRLASVAFVMRVRTIQRAWRASRASRASRDIGTGIMGQ